MDGDAGALTLTGNKSRYRIVNSVGILTDLFLLGWLTRWMWCRGSSMQVQCRILENVDFVPNSALEKDIQGFATSLHKQRVKLMLHELLAP
jgi:hypothetical protein